MKKLNCRIQISQGGVEVFNPKGKPSKMYGQLVAKYGEAKALDAMHLISNEDAYASLSQYLNNDGEYSLEIVDKYIEAIEEVAMGEVTAIDRVMASDIASQLRVYNVNNLINQLEAIIENNEKPYILDGIEASYIQALVAKLKNTDSTINLEFTEDMVLTDKGYRSNYEVLDPLLSAADTRTQFDTIVVENGTDNFVDRYTSDDVFADTFYQSYTDRTKVSRVDDQGNAIEKPNALSETLLAMTVGNSPATELAEVMITSPDFINDNSLQQLAEEAAKVGVDFTEVVSNRAHKTDEQLIELLTSYVRVNLVQDQSAIEAFENTYTAYFDTVLEQDVTTLRLNTKEELQELKTTQTEAQVFQEQNLIKVHGDLHKKVVPITIQRMVEDTLEKIVFQNNLESELPNKAFTGKELDNAKELNLAKLVETEGIDLIRANLTTYFRGLGNTITDINIRYHKDQNKALMTELSERLGEPSAQDSPSKSFLSMNPQTLYNSEYLLGDYLTDFNATKLSEKLKDSALYQNFYQFMSVTERGVRANDLSYDALQKMVNYSDQLSENNRQNLIQHLALTNENYLMDIMDTGFEAQPILKDTYKEYLQRNPDTLAESNGVYKNTSDNSISSETITDEYIRLPNGKIYEKTEDNGVEAKYRELSVKDALDPTDEITKDFIPIREVEIISKPLSNNKVKSEGNRRLKETLEC